MISSGLFVLPGIAFAIAGPSMLLGYLIASVLMLPALLSKAELSTAMPKSGGNYFFMARSLGPLMGTVAGLLDWFSVAMKTAFALVGIGGLLLFFLPQYGIWGIKLTAAVACLLFALLNLFSVKGSGTFQIVLVFFLIAILALVVGTGFATVQVERFSPFLAGGWDSVFSVAGMVFVSFGGLTKVTAVAEEVKNPSRNIPLSMLLAFFIISALYLLTVYITIGNVPAHELSGSLTPVAIASKYAIGSAGAILVSVAAFLAFATTGNAGIMAASRSPMAMSRDGLLPSWFSRTHKRFRTPLNAIVATSLFIGFTVLFISIEVLVKTASTIMILMFALVNLSVIVMRTSQIEGYRPTFRAPFFPYLQILAILLYSFLIWEMGVVPVLITGGFILFALIWYLIYVQRRINNESAIVYLVKRITSHHLERAHIENELRAIALERDSVEFDRFDNLVKGGIILDIHEATDAKALFALVSQHLSSRLEESPEELLELFLERERVSSTVMTPGLAIPHIIVSGSDRFEVVLVRAKSGVMFSELHPKVHTMFVLAGSHDERNFHLRALMSIAHIVQEAEFEQRWESARNQEQLRDVILLSGRTRGTQS